MGRLQELNEGKALTTGAEEARLPSGIYRIVSGGSDVTVQTKINGGTFTTIGTVSSGESKDLHIGEGTSINCTFTGTATLQRVQGAS